MKVRTILIKLSTEIRHNEIPSFRGAINALLDENHSILFHNHTDEGFRFAYPLIQYKRIGGKAAILCMGEGSTVINDFFEKEGIDLQIGTRKERCELEEVIAKNHDISQTNEIHQYRIRKWLPFNSENYKSYINSNGIVEKCQILEKILTGNILSMAKGLGITLEFPLEVKVKEIIDSKSMLFKGVNMMSLDIDFMANISLPNYCGLGKGVSHGFGTITNS